MRKENRRRKPRSKAMKKEKVARKRRQLLKKVQKEQPKKLENQKKVENQKKAVSQKKVENQRKEEKEKRKQHQLLKLVKLQRKSKKELKLTLRPHHLEQRSMTMTLNHGTVPSNLPLMRKVNICLQLKWMVRKSIWTINQEMMMRNLSRSSKLRNKESMNKYRTTYSSPRTLATKKN